MAIMEISIFPLGTGSPSISRHVADGIRAIPRDKKLRYTITPMGTTVEGDLDRLLSLAKKMHRAVLKGDVKRVITTIKIDERLDKELSMEGKVEAVREKL